MRQPATNTDIRRDLVGLLPRIRRFAMTLASDTLEADELVQVACHRAVAKSHQWKGDGRLEIWLYTLIRQIFIEDSRKRKMRHSPTGRGNVTDIREAARERAGSGETDALNQLVAAMPEGTASLFLLVCVEGHTHKEAAEIMGVSPDSIASRLASARLYFAAAAQHYSHG